MLCYCFTRNPVWNIQTDEKLRKINELDSLYKLRLGKVFFHYGKLKCLLLVDWPNVFSQMLFYLSDIYARVHTYVVLQSFYKKVASVGWPLRTNLRYGIKSSFALNKFEIIFLFFIFYYFFKSIVALKNKNNMHHSSIIFTLYSAIKTVWSCIQLI